MYDWNYLIYRLSKIEKNQHLNILIFLSIFYFRILPVAAFCEICRFFGSATFMDTYKGRDLTSPKSDVTSSDMDIPSTDYTNGFTDITREVNGKVKTT